MRTQLKEIGVLTKTGKEFFTNCIVFPLTDRWGHIVNFYGRHLKKDGHYFLPGERTGLFYPPKECDEVILTEGVFDMLTLYFLFVAAGHPVSPGVLLAGYGLPLIPYLQHTSHPIDEGGANDPVR